MFSRTIVVRSLEKPHQKSTAHDIEWVCDSLGFNSGRDLENVSSRLVAAILDKFASQPQLSTELLADDLVVTAARVNHHVRNLADSGFLYRKNKLIFLRGGSLKGAIEEMRKDANRIFDELAGMAEEIDASIGLKNR